MKQLASFASLGEMKNDAVFDFWGNVMLGLYNNIGLCGMYILICLIFLLSEV